MSTSNDRVRNSRIPNGHTTPSIVLVDSGRLFEILVSRVGEEIMEATLLRLLFPGEISGFALEGEGLALMYRYHFSLYHALYHLRSAASEKGFNLQIRPCRVRLVEDLPGRCSFISIEDGARCGRESGPTGYCGEHLGEPGPLEEVSMREFYLDSGNIAEMSPDDLKEMVKGYAGLVISRDEVRRAYADLALPFGASSREIRERFRVLAMASHPDMAGGDHDEFGRINRAYRTLLRLVPETDRSAR